LRITADTNILVRVLVEDDAEQTSAAQALLRDAELVAVPVTVLCELVWVLRRGYRLGTRRVVSILEAILDVERIVTDRPAAEAGLAVLRAGGDFADGVIAHQGLTLGGEVFASFDRDALKQWQTSGGLAVDPSDWPEQR
jgi:predicted nucleic-acid-binding protein